MVNLKYGRIINLHVPPTERISDSIWILYSEKTIFQSLYIQYRILLIGGIPRGNNFEKGFSNYHSELDGTMENYLWIKDDQIYYFEC